MSNKRAWYGRPNRPPINWDTPDRPSIRKVSAIESPSEDLLHEYDITLTNENWVALLKCLAVYEASDPQPSVKLWRQRIRETVLAQVEIKGVPQKKAWVRLRYADLDEIMRQVRIVCAGWGAAWDVWAAQLEHALSVRRGKD